MSSKDLFCLDREYLKKHFGFNTPVAVVRTTNNSNLDHMHHHDFTELSMILSGEGSYRDKNDEYSLRPGDIFVTRPGTMHHYIRQKNLIVADIIWFESELQLNWQGLNQTPGWRTFFQLMPASRDIHRSGIFHLTTSQMAEAESLIMKMSVELSGNSSGNLLMATSLLQMLLTSICRWVEESEDKSEIELRRLSRAVLYMNKHFSDEIRRSQLARAAGMSESSFYRHFCALLKQSPNQYLNELRLRKAGELLLTTDRSLEEIAMQCGFCDGNYFGRMFKQRYGISPRNYRKEKKAANK